MTCRIPRATCLPLQAVVPAAAAAVLLLAFSTPAHPQMTRAAAGQSLDGSAAGTTVRAAPLTGGIRIDGVLDESSWQAAEAITSFTQRVPDEGEPASERTEVRVLVGPDALYIAARLFDSEPDRIRAALVRRDVVSDFDYFIVNLDSRHDHNTALAFTLTPSGAWQDAALGVDGEYDFGCDPVWEGAATIDDQGWSAEWRIPFSQLRFESTEHAEWGIQFTRVIARKGETATYPFTPSNETSGPHRPDFWQVEVDPAAAATLRVRGHG